MTGGPRGRQGHALDAASTCRRVISRATTAEVTLKDAHEHAPETDDRLPDPASSRATSASTQIALRVGKDRLQAWIKRFGFGVAHRHRLPGRGRRAAVLPSDKWSGTGILNIPIGQGVRRHAHPAHPRLRGDRQRRALVTPHLVATGARRTPGRRIMHASTARKVDRMLRKVVVRRRAPAIAGRGEGLRGGRQDRHRARRSTRRPARTATPRYTSSFVGYAPADDPQLLVAVVVDEPTGSYYGGDVAAPAFEKIAEFSLQTLRIPP